MFKKLLPSKLLPIFVIGIFLTFLSTIYIKNLLAEEQVQVYFGPSSLILPNDSSANIIFNSGEHEIAFVKLKFTFDPNVVKLIEEVEVSPTLSNVISKTTLEEANNTGEVIISAGLALEDKDNPPSGEITFARISFTSNTDENNVISDFTIDTAELQIVNPEPTLLIAGIQNAILTINPVTPSPTPISTLPSDGASLVITGESQAFINEEYTVGIEINTTNAITGVDANIKYDPSVLKPLRVEGLNLIGETLNQIDEDNSIVRISQVSDVDNPYTGTGKIATIIFMPLKEGETNLTFEYSPESLDESNVIASKTGEDILDLPQDFTLSVTDYIRISFQILTESTNPILGHTTDGLLNFGDNNIPFVTNGEGVGEIKLDVFPSEPLLNLSAKVEGYLPKTKSISLNPGTNIVDFGKLTAGDLNNDGIVNTLDISLMYDNWFEDGTSNFNKDQRTNTVDYWILIQNFFKVE